jgi:signal transduction histidine kinase
MYYESSGEHFLKITVKDDGLGIKKADIPKLFSPFGVIESSRNFNPNGIGLGLHICKNIIE